MAVSVNFVIDVSEYNILNDQNKQTLLFSYVLLITPCQLLSCSQSEQVSLKFPLQLYWISYYRQQTHISHQSTTQKGKNIIHVEI